MNAQTRLEVKQVPGARVQAVKDENLQKEPDLQWN
jgi:hypothetical protein